ncbi:MAG: ferritin family protein [Phycisphaerae bacterium]|nr:ferritin family protein [Phycisphaerae bacterium]
MPADRVERILDLAIAREEGAAEFYRYLAGETRQDHMKAVFLDFAREEESHKAKLVIIKGGRRGLLSEEKVLDLGLADQLEDEPIDLAGDMDYARALVIAMKLEQEAHDFYTRLAVAAADGECKSVLLGLAQEEAKHKQRFELEYDEHVLKEN